MTLSDETETGIKIIGTVHIFVQLDTHSEHYLFPIPVASFKELLPYILSRQGVTSFLSEKLSQDPWRNSLVASDRRGDHMRIPPLQNFTKTHRAYE